jgi:uncharacterized protein (DUF1800 family)
MVQAATGAGRAAVPSRWLAATALFVSAVLLASVADAQSRAAAVGLYRGWASHFYLDGDFDSIGDKAIAFGGPGEIGMLADIKGSGVRSPATFNPSTGLWRFDTDGDGTADVSIYFGGVGDKPVVGDMDGDGKDDLVVWRNGTWLVSTTGDGRVNSWYSFGGYSQDIPLLADMNGDGALDLIIYRDGNWYVSTRRDGNGDLAYRFGGTSDGRDIPIAFDYDGDGVGDIAYFRNGRWYVSTRRDGVANVVFHFGMSGDRPLYFGRGAIESVDVQAARLLQQATFGPTLTEIARLKSMGIPAWIDDQLAKPITFLPGFPWYPAARPTPPTNPPPATSWPLCTHAMYTTTAWNSASPCNCSDVAGTTNRCQRDVYSAVQLQRGFFVAAFTAQDQLRQRVAWALSQLLVTSSLQDPIAYANRDYQQLLMNYAFGNYFDLLNNVSFSPFMGNYLDSVNNRKAAGTRQPNENYAREILQLFTIGLWELNPDGSLLLDVYGNPIPTYDQADITELSRVYTGLVYPPLPGRATALNSTVNYAAPMAALETEHDTGPKRILDLGTIGYVSTAWDITNANRAIFSHPNVGPYVSKHLIQQLVTSNPSPAFVRDVAAVFANNGAGVRGDLRAVVRAILLHPDARAPRNPVTSAFGKLKEPVLLVTSLLRALGATSDGVDPIFRTRVMGQDVYASPTVFNYYPADYTLPGTNLAAPPFGIFDATTYFSRTNWIYNQVTLGASCTGNVCGPAADTSYVGAVGTRVDYSSLVALAADPAALVDRVDELLMQKTMPKFMRQQIINAVAAYGTSAAELLNRARTAVYLTASSPRFQTEF